MKSIILISPCSNLRTHLTTHYSQKKRPSWPPHLYVGHFPSAETAFPPLLLEKFLHILKTPSLMAPHGQCDTQWWHGALELGNQGACPDSLTNWLCDFGQVSLPLWTSGRGKMRVLGRTRLFSKSLLALISWWRGWRGKVLEWDWPRSPPGSALNHCVSMSSYFNSQSLNWLT